MKVLWLLFACLASACTSAWEPVPLAGGYQIMVMNSQEAYIANADRELILGPSIKAIGVAEGVIIVDCGPEERLVNGFANTVGLNLIDTKNGTVMKRLTPPELERVFAGRHEEVPQMRELSVYLK